jgi:hypothetical protein
MRPGRLLVLAPCLAVLSVASIANAQVYVGAGTPARGSIEIGGGGVWAAGFDMGSRQAGLSRSTATDRFDLFSVESKVSGFPGVHARVGFYLTSAVAIEGGVRFARPKLSVRLSGDAESAPDETATQTANHYLFDGSVLFHFTRASFAGGRGVPFVSGGAGYVRELHERNELVETGREYHATGGIKYWFGSGRRRLGLRAEVGLSAREKGFDDEEKRRMLPLALGGLTFLF